MTTTGKLILKPLCLVSTARDGYVVYDTECNRFHELNPSAAFLLELCNGQHTVDEVLTMASEILPPNSDTAVVAWIAEAKEQGLLQEVDELSESEEPVFESCDLSQMAAQLRDNGFVQAAYICQQHAVEIARDNAADLRELGELAHILGKREAAREAFEQYLRLKPDDAEVRHLLTALRDEQPPDRVPDGCIQQLYRRFARFYESNMCDELGYEGPQHLTQVIDEVMGGRTNLCVLDLGCGTGLGGLAVRERTGRLVGVDLSPEMIEKAFERGIYDSLQVEEVTHWLRESTESFDLIIACDTFIYFGDLSPVLALATKRLAVDGVIAFSVERAKSGSCQLTDSGRYAHHRTHIMEAADRVGLEVTCSREAFIRMEYGVPVEGLYVCLTRRSRPDERVMDRRESVRV